ncbi:MAG: sugar ABC transporter permease [Actinomyces sp.]|uniref:carbohydrate ABC transporter permease n=1 Tax=Actinomyces sp. TaxID=29317 RepID=UPI0026DB2730|nr:sugar ABC transporter permease [Actinomyces sp.]MDO4242758.1 sugar ABC transporter permease [Actinomyces sp.]
MSTRRPRSAGAWAARGPGSRGAGRRGTGVTGWLFVSPAVVVLTVFMLLPVLMALWVSVSDWSGVGSPLSGEVGFVGASNYTDLVGGGLAERDLGIALRNNLWYVLLVVPLQTLLALTLAVLVNQRVIARGVFRTAFYFPSVTSSVAITVLWLFLFSASGAVNTLLSIIGIHGPNWFNDPRGIVASLLGLVGIDGSDTLTAELLGVSAWEWLSGPSFAMTAFIVMAVFTTSGTFMLIFLSALQSLNPSVDEAAMIDGAGTWTRFWRVTVPQLKPTLFTVITLGLVGCWQVFDQIYTGTQGDPGKTTLTPAYLSYDAAFLKQDWGRGSAIAFVLFGIIVLMTLLQRWVLRDRDASRRAGRRRTPARVGVAR